MKRTLLEYIELVRGYGLEIFLAVYVRAKAHDKPREMTLGDALEESLAELKERVNGLTVERLEKHIEYLTEKKVR